ncbi:hypothetical protein Pdw03_1886 [Penicillium digitatum]|uniref:Uncharacterized protein n=1 Tax=Penicillium digitatum TaxID=36651 RepID=A0A7T6XT80_PENDI|nr:hypothetical protein Pdw03_1886 [Penicillium digitatum]
MVIAEHSIYRRRQCWITTANGGRRFLTLGLTTRCELIGTRSILWLEIVSGVTRKLTREIAERKLLCRAWCRR